MLVENEEVFVVDCEDAADKSILYLPLRSYLALVTSDIATELVGNGGYSARRAAFFAAIKKRPLLDMSEIIRNLHACNPELSLALTDDCSLRCIYCHASAGEQHKRNSMSHEMIGAVIETYFSSITPQKRVKVNFNGGGEPTYAFSELQYAVRMANLSASRLGASCNFAMATNGFYGDDIRQFIVDNFSQVSLSLDGPAFIHNLHRPTATGKDSFAVVYETAKFFHESKLPFAFRATISAHSMDYWEDIVDFFATNFPSKSVGFEHLNPFGRAATCNDSRIRPPGKEAFADRLVQVLKYAESKPIKILNSASTEYDIVRPIFCSNVGIPSWTVTTAGEIAACGRDNPPDDFVFGKFDCLNKKVIIDAGKLKKLHDMVVTNYAECTDCFCKYHCAGDCPDRRLADKSDCGAIRKVGRYVLNCKISQKEIRCGNAISAPTKYGRSSSK